jgi:serine/threonine protein kinase
MQITCPTCRHAMSVKDAKPGQYKPKCAKCGERFALTIYADAREPKVEALVPVAAPASVSAPVAAAAKTTAGLESTMSPGFSTTVSPPAKRPKESPVGTDSGAPKQELGTTLSPGVGTTFNAPSHAPIERPAPASVPSRTEGSDPQATAAYLAPVRGSAETTAQRVSDTTQPASGQVTRADQPVPPNPPDMPAQIGGYRVVRELGRGAMGAVYLARQLSLDREVAIKTIQGQWADNPTFIARFTREAYAAAQLAHHNVVQIYDLGVAGDTHFFSMELVRGESLDRVIKREQKLDAELAVGYVLQAARGLEFAHNHGMVHRDVKPANLMLSEHGVVKVADLGLVKTPQVAEAEEAAEQGTAPKTAGKGSSLAAATADVTLANMAMGTPAYMAPEQSENAAGVDHRADIYSLGCTLYVLLTGRPPFEGASALEVITKHKTEPVVRPEAIVKRMPKGLSDITLKMVAKRPEDRYANLGEVIKALEGFMGIQSSGPYSPKEEHAKTLDECLAAFNASSLAKLRGPILLSGLLLCGLLFVVGLFFSWQMSAAMAALIVSAVGSNFIVSGVLEKTFLFGKFREWLAMSGPSDWFTWMGAAAALATVALILGWIGTLVAMILLGVIAGLAYYFVLDRGIARQRKEPLEKMHQLLKTLRLKGVDEAALHQFVAKYSGNHWEEFFEGLFGYEAKLAARKQWGKSDAGRDRPKFRGWREWLVRWIDARLVAWREERDRKHLQQLEEKSLQAQGMDLITARRRAQLVTDAILDDAAETRAAAAQPPASKPVDPALEAAKKRSKVKTMLAEAKKGAYQAKRKRLAGTALSPLAMVLGGKMRFLLGCLLIAGCALWARQNGLVSQENLANVKAAVETSVQDQNAASLAGAAQTIGQQQTTDLAIPAIGKYLSSFNAGVAGLVLVVLGMFRGWKMSLFALPAAAVMVLGPTLGVIPTFPELSTAHVSSLAIGLVIAAIGFFFGRTYDEYGN